MASIFLFHCNIRSLSKDFELLHDLSNCFDNIQYCAKEIQMKFGVFRSLFSRKLDEIFKSKLFINNLEISFGSKIKFSRVIICYRLNTLNHKSE